MGRSLHEERGAQAAQVTYEIRSTRAADREALDLPDAVFDEVNATIRNLGSDPRPPGCKKLKGVRGHAYRVRVGSHRILYMIDDRAHVVTVFRIAHRRDAYRRL
jgi:mRNA interferase RelE/StbE